MATESGPPAAGLGAGGPERKDREEPGGRGSPPSRQPFRDGGGALEEDLREDPRSFGFFQAVRLLQRLRPGRDPVGKFARPGEEVVRFSVNPSLAFAAGEIQELWLDDEDGPGEMEVNFLGLVGNQGVLPSQYSSLVMEESREAERPLTDFLNLFQHRLLSLFYAAWERARFYVPFERGEPDRVSRHLLDLIGLGHERLRDRMPVRDEAFLFYCGLLGMRQRSAVALRQILEDYFQVPVEIEQFVGGWYGLSERARCRVDDEAPPDGAGLGEGTVVGDEIWDPQARVRIRVGPLSRERYDEFLPGESAHEALRTLARFFADGQYDFEVQLVLAREEVPGIVLGDETEQDQAPPLGWCTWIRTEAFDRDADETTLTL